MPFRRPALFLLLLLATFVFAADYRFTPPRVFDAMTYPARDAHPGEHVTIAADPYDMPDKAATVFKKVAFHDAGFLPIHLIVTNQAETPLFVDQIQVTLVTREKHAKIRPAQPEDIYRRIGKQVMHDSQPPMNPLPKVHLPNHGKASITRAQQAEVEQSRWSVPLVAAHDTQAGFLFFDVEGLENPLAGAHLEITGLKSGGKELFFFEVPMEDYLGYRPARP